MTNTKCIHEWEEAKDQSDTGKIGIRERCKKCGLTLVNINPLKYKKFRHQL